MVCSRFGLDMVSVYGIDNVENFRIILFCDFSLPSETDDIDIQSLVDKMYLVGQYGRGFDEFDCPSDESWN